MLHRVQVRCTLSRIALLQGDKKRKLYGCSCMLNEDEVVTSGFCDEECKAFIPYAVVLFVVSLINGMYIIPVIMTIMR